MQEENKHKFETLIKGNAPKDENRKWYPYRVSIYQENFLVDNVSLAKNLAYNMQYIQFLEKSFSELVLSEPLTKMLIKSYALTSGAIIEGLLVNISITNDWSKTPPDFSNLINTTRDKCKACGADESVLNTIDELRKLRNRIHLQRKHQFEDFDHDYNAFTDEVLIETRELLYTVLISPEISKDTSVFNFLKEAIDNSKTIATKS